MLQSFVGGANRSRRFVRFVSSVGLISYVRSVNIVPSVRTLSSVRSIFPRSLPASSDPPACSATAASVICASTSSTVASSICFVDVFLRGQSRRQPASAPSAPCQAHQPHHLRLFAPSALSAPSALQLRQSRQRRLFHQRHPLSHLRRQPLSVCADISASLSPLSAPSTQLDSS